MFVCSRNGVFAGNCQVRRMCQGSGDDLATQVAGFVRQVGVVPMGTA
jgi:hypothetical protein